MTQNASADSSNSPLSEELGIVKASLVERNACQLMDELFKELEQDLNPSNLKASVESGQTVLQPPLETLNSTWVPLSHYSLNKRGVKSFEQEPLRGLPYFFNYWVLLAVASTSILALLLMGLGFWLQSSGVVTSTVATLQPANPPKPDPAELEFATYLQRSLEAIERNAPPHPTVATIDTQPAGALPTITLPTTPPSTLKVPRVAERVYIPVYQPQPALVAHKYVVIKKAPPVAKTSPPGSKPVPKVAVVPATPVVLPLTHTLVGVLELGDRSAALININGVPRRVQVGEDLGASGWSLLKVADQKAIIQRKGELRSIFVGQEF